MANQPDPDIVHCVLGIDAAWTAHNPSGVALVQRAAEGWQCLALAPSYDAFLALSKFETSLATSELDTDKCLRLVSTTSGSSRLLLLPLSTVAEPRK